MAFELARSALQLTDATASIISAAAGFEAIPSTAEEKAEIIKRVVRPKKCEDTLNCDIGPIKINKECTCKDQQPSPPPCYSCTFNLQHSPPPYNNEFRRKSRKNSQEETHCSSRNETVLSDLKTSSQEITTSYDSNNAPLSTPKTDHCILHPHEHHHSSAGGKIETSVRPKIFPRRGNVHAGSNRLNYDPIPESETSPKSIDSNQSASIQTSHDRPTIARDPSPFRERLGSVNAFRPCVTSAGSMARSPSSSQSVTEIDNTLTISKSTSTMSVNYDEHLHVPKTDYLEQIEDSGCASSQRLISSSVNKSISNLNEANLSLAASTGMINLEQVEFIDDATSEQMENESVSDINLPAASDLTDDANDEMSSNQGSPMPSQMIMPE